jgi:hypothetical protein
MQAINHRGKVAVATTLLGKFADVLGVLPEELIGVVPDETEVVQ